MVLSADYGIVVPIKGSHSYLHQIQCMLNSFNADNATVPMFDFAIIDAPEMRQLPVFQSLAPPHVDHNCMVVYARNESEFYAMTRAAKARGFLANLTIGDIHPLVRVRLANPVTATAKGALMGTLSMNITVQFRPENGFTWQIPSAGGELAHPVRIKSTLLVPFYQSLIHSLMMGATGYHNLCNVSVSLLEVSFRLQDPFPEREGVLAYRVMRSCFLECMKNAELIPHGTLVS